MNSRIPLLVVGALLCCPTARFGLSAESTPAEQPEPRITIGKDTTRITKPVDEHGYVDYLGALQQRCKQGVTPQNNVAVAIWQTIGPASLRHHDEEFLTEFYGELGIMPLPDEGDYLVSLYDVAVRAAGGEINVHDPDALAGDVWDQQSEAMKRPWSGEDFPILKKWVDENQRPLDEFVRSMKTKDRYYAPLLTGSESQRVIEVLLPTAQESREIARTLAARAMLRLGAGDTDAAWQDLLTCHRLARHYSRAPAVIEAVVCHTFESLACQADESLIRSDKLTAEQARQCLADLEQLPALPNVADCLDVMERYVFLDSVASIARDGEAGIDEHFGEAVGRNMGKAFAAASIDWNEPLRMGNRFFDAIVAGARKPTFDERKAADAKVTEDQLRELEKGGDLQALGKILLGKSPRKIAGQAIGRAMLRLMLPATFSASVAEDRALTRTDLTRVGFALTAYAADHGQFPKSIEELAPKYISKIPKDRFTEERLRYAAAEKSFLLYSLGSDQKDQGGVDDWDHPDKTDYVLRVGK